MGLRKLLLLLLLISVQLNAVVAPGLFLGAGCTFSTEALLFFERPDSLRNVVQRLRSHAIRIRHARDRVRHS